MFEQAIAKAMPTESQYQHLMLCLQIGNTIMPGKQTLSTLVNEIYSAAQQASKAPTSIGEKRAVTDEDVANKANKKPAPKKCSDCFKYLCSTCTDHKSNSNSCPCSSKNWPYQTWSSWQKYLSNSNKEGSPQKASADAHNLRVFWEVSIGRWKAMNNTNEQKPFTQLEEDAIKKWYYILVGVHGESGSNAGTEKHNLSSLF